MDTGRLRHAVTPTDLAQLRREAIDAWRAMLRADRTPSPALFRAVALAFAITGVAASDLDALN